MHGTSVAFRSIALVMILVVSLTLLAPAEAHADILTALAIAGLVVTGVILVAFLVIANVSDHRAADEPRVVWLACAEPAACPGLAAPSRAAAAAAQSESP
jgi:hypothetical protein